MFDLKVMNSVLGELEEERGIPREKVIEAIEAELGLAGDPLEDESAPAEDPRPELLLEADRDVHV